MSERIRYRAVLRTLSGFHFLEPMSHLEVQLPADLKLLRLKPQLQREVEEDEARLITIRL